MGFALKYTLVAVSFSNPVDKSPGCNTAVTNKGDSLNSARMRELGEGAAVRAGPPGGSCQ